MATEDLSATIAAAAAKPQRVKAGDVEVQGHSLADLVEADKHLSRKAAGRSRTGGLRFTKIVNPGTV